MDQQLLGCRRHLPVTVDRVEKRQLLAPGFQHLRCHRDPLANPDLGQVAHVVFHREPAALGGDIVGRGSDPQQEPVARLRHRLHVAAFVHVVVAIDPVRRHLALQRDHRLHQVRHLGRNGFLVRVQHFAYGTAALLEAAHHADQVAIAQAFQLRDRHVPRLRVRLACDHVDQFVGQLRHVHQLGPGPFQRRAELADEMLHPRRATGHAIGFKEPHLPPAQAKAHADRIVDFLGRRDTVLDQPQRLAPDRFQEAVGNVGGDFLTHFEREKPNGFKKILGPVQHRGLGLVRSHQFDQRQKVDRVERMRDDDLPGPRGAALQFRRHEARGRRADDRVWIADRLHLLVELLLQLQPLRRAFLDPDRTLDGLADRAVKRKLPLGWKGHVVKRGQRAARAPQHRGQRFLGRGRRVEHPHVPAHQQEPRGPTAADDATAQDGCCLGHVIPRSFPCARQRPSPDPTPCCPCPTPGRAPCSRYPGP